MKTKKEPTDKKTLGTWISVEVKRLVEDVASNMGISPSEYVRSLVLTDLRQRGYFVSFVAE